MKIIAIPNSCRQTLPSRKTSNFSTKKETLKSISNSNNISRYVMMSGDGEASWYLLLIHPIFTRGNANRTSVQTGTKVASSRSHATQLFSHVSKLIEKF